MEYKLKDYRKQWCIVWTEAGRTRRASTGYRAHESYRPAAERFLAEWVAAREKPKALSTCADVFDYYVKDRQEAGKVMRGILDALRPIRKDWNDMPVSAITYDTARIYRRKRAGRSNGTVRRELAIARAAFKLAERRGLIDRAPSFELPPPAAAREHWLTREEVDALIRVAAPHVALFVWIASTTGARPGAILGLLWSRVELGAHKALFDFRGEVETTKRRTVVPVTNRDALKALAVAQEAALTPYVIEYGGKPVRSVRKGLLEAGRKAGLPNVTPGVFRHSVATWLAMEGKPMEKIAEMLGHSSTEMVRRHYAKFSPDYLMDVAGALA